MAKPIWVGLSGMPNSGKGTMVHNLPRRIAERVKVVSMGDELRKERRLGTEDGKKVGAYMDAGKFVPNEVLIPVAKNILKRVESEVRRNRTYREMAIILDGFPRDLEQAKALLKEGIRPKEIITLYVDSEVAIDRAKNRRMCSSCGATFDRRKMTSTICRCGGALVTRKDDAKIEQRIDDYKKYTEPAIEWMARDMKIPQVIIFSGKEGTQESFNRAIEDALH